MCCPLHEDGKVSASLNINKMEWFCMRCEVGGRVATLIKQQASWLPPGLSGPSKNGNNGRNPHQGEREAITEGKIAGWHSALLSNPKRLRIFRKRRGLSIKTIKQFQIGWDEALGRYTIPVRNPDGGFWNVRRYHPKPQGDEPKMKSVYGYGSPARPFPLNIFDSDPREIVVCEGELDALLCIQKGIPAFTKTGAAKVWDDVWTDYFKGRRVYLIHDMDTAGQAANNKIAMKLSKVAREVRIVNLPYEVMDKHGKDLTDFFLDGATGSDLRQLMSEALPERNRSNIKDLDPTDANLLETLDANKVGKPLRTIATVQAKVEPGHTLPKKCVIACTMDKGAICAICPLMIASGRSEFDIDQHDPILLALMDSTSQQIKEIIRESRGIPKCNRIDLDVIEYQAVETLFVRPSVDHVKVTDDSRNHQKVRKVISVGRHDTQPNTTIEITGALWPEPRRQRNEFLAWDVSERQTSLDNFSLDDDMRIALRRFKPREGQTPLQKSIEIAQDMSMHITKIYGRDEMHVAMDLTFHSVLSFDFDGQRVDRGWLELLVLGDTRTGKSEVATQMVRHYGLGDIYSCESASIAGLLGGMQQHGGSSDWTISWGVLPLNDRRLVVLDEAGGLAREDIAQLSSIRSSGEAQITKVGTGGARTSARTRLIWCANPPGRRMEDYTYGVDAIQPLIGNAEDVARFDLAMTVASDIETMSINKHRAVKGDTLYPDWLCNNLVRWAWSRTRNQIVFTPGAINLVYKAANHMGGRYIERPPLIQAANVRIKIARTAAALAARTFSTDKTCESIIITRDHVRDSVRLIDMLYSMPSFGYLERSREALRDIEIAKGNIKEMRKYLDHHDGLAKFLRNSGRFKRQDIEEILNYSREAANGVINKLHQTHMVRKEEGFVIVAPVLHKMLREIK